MNAEKEYVLFICGGKWQVPWFQYLKAKGHFLALVDPFSTSACVPQADVFIQCDARDVDEILRQVKNRNLKISFVTSEQTDVSAIPVAEISKKLGKFANPPEVVHLFANKFKNRAFFQKNHLGHHPKFARVSTLEDLNNFLQSTAGKIIVKPVDAQSSRGIFLVEKTIGPETISLFQEALSFSKKHYLIAEEFIDGKEITVEGFCNNGIHKVLIISDKKHFRTGIASELKYPAKLNASLKENLETFHNDLISKMGLLFGITHAEYMVSKDESDFWLVEVACRGGGSLIPSHIVPWVSGFRIYDALYDCITQLGVSKIPFPEGDQQAAILYFFEFPNGKVQKIEGTDTIENRPDVFSFGLEFKEGDTIQAANDDRSRQGYVIVKAEDESSLDAALDQIKNTLKVSFCS